jgi:predicted DNA-binding transcriptional regulator YafY
MRADRLLSILLTLQVGRRITAGELAERLEVSERTILRDMECLSAAGVPVTADRGAGGGWRLAQPYKTDLTGLSSGEIQSLFFGKSSRLLSDLGMSQAAEAALIKLLTALPAVARRDVAAMRERIHIDGAGWHQSDEAFPLLPVLQDALWQDRRVRLLYQRADGTEVERVVDPLGLVAKGSIWYFVGAVEGEARSYRVSRAKEATILEEASVRPDGFDLASYWEQAVAELKANVPRYPAVLRVRPEVVPRLRRYVYARSVEAGEPDRAGWVPVSVVFEVEEEACDFVVRAGGQIVVVEPEALRARVKAVAQSVAAING